jgi:hypothetical protein
MNIILFVIIFCIVLFIIFYILNKNGSFVAFNYYFSKIESFVETITDSNFKNLEKIKSNIDGDLYFVQSEFSDKKEAGELLSELNNLVKHFINHLKYKYPTDPRIQRIITKFPDTNDIIEGNPINNSNSTAYSVDKGRKLVICLRSKKNKKLHNKNVLMFVILHELSHIASSSYGHNQEFTDNFKFLLSEAIQEGVYKKVDFVRHPQEYCGLQIYTSPL